MTSDTADNDRIRVVGGGADSDTRGAALEACGNEYGTPGVVSLYTGAVP